MQDGLYCLRFQTPRGTGAGVVMLRAGKLWGGDTSMYYLGTYQESGTQFTASVQSKRHTPGLPSIFIVDDVTINLRGTAQGNSAKLTGTSPQAAGVSLGASLAWLAP